MDPNLAVPQSILASAAGAPLAWAGLVVYVAAAIVAAVVAGVLVAVAID